MMKKIYFAGKFKFNSTTGELSERLTNDYRSILLGTSLKLTYPNKNTLLQNYPIHYCGPFYFEQASNGDFTSTDCLTVMKEEMKTIENSEIFCCVFDLNFSVGGIVELIEAAHMKKRIAVFYKNESSNYTIKSDYWFAICKAMDICKKNNTIFESFSYNEELLPILYNWLNNLIYTKKYVIVRENNLNNILKKGKIINKFENDKKTVYQYEVDDDKIVVEQYLSGLIIVKSKKNLEYKGFIDVTNNQLYLDENIDNLKFTNIFIEGTDGVGKTTTIVKLIEKGIICLDRSDFICQYMLLTIPMKERISAYKKFFKDNPSYSVLFLINNSKEELKDRINKRTNISEYDKLAYEYNQLYLDTYKEWCKINLDNKIKLIDCTNLSIEKQVEKVENCILRGWDNE